MSSTQVTPLTNGSNGNHDVRGRFTKGNAAARGRRQKHAEHVGRLRTAVVSAFTADGVLRVIAALETLAEDSNVHAIKEYLDRAVGKPIALDVAERIRELEEA